MSPHDTIGLEVQVGLAVIKTLILLTGTAVTLLSYRAYRRTGDAGLRLLALGFGLITLGTILAGVTFEVLGLSLGAGILIESILVLAGLVVIMLSLRVDR